MILYFNTDRCLCAYIYYMLCYLVPRSAVLSPVEAMDEIWPSHFSVPQCHRAFYYLLYLFLGSISRTMSKGSNDPRFSAMHTAPVCVSRMFVFLAHVMYRSSSKNFTKKSLRLKWMIDLRRCWQTSVSVLSRVVTDLAILLLVSCLLFRSWCQRQKEEKECQRWPSWVLRDWGREWSGLWTCFIISN